MSLDKYRTKRDFSRTPEPSGASDGGVDRAPAGGGRFVVQRHRASRLHYDFRLEIGGVLVSWAVPKGPSLDPSVRRGAFKVEDHPLGYYDFEGTIPAGEYGGGDVIVWDWGTFEPEKTADPARSVADGELKFALHGEKLNGRFTIVRTKGRSAGSGGSTGSAGSTGSGDSDDWLLIKKRDATAVDGWDPEGHPLSVKTGRTNEEVAAGLEPAASHGQETPMPAFIEPMTATLTDGPFSNPDWLFELKWDGYRVQAHVDGGRVSVYTRRGLDAAEYFPELAGPPTWISARRAIVDGEVVALDADGKPDFGLLQARRGNGLRRAESSTLAYAVFDLLYLDGRSLLNEPLEERKKLLRSVLIDAGPVRYASHVVGDGVEFYEAVAARGLEGVMAKLRSSRYESGRRSAAWLKIKRRAEQEFVIVGWTPRQGSDDDLGALVLGVYQADALTLAGKVGTGFDADERRRLVELLRPLALSGPIVADRPLPREPKLTWVDPSLVARVEFAEWTADGQLRAPVYKGLDLDADPQSVVRERAGRAGSDDVQRSTRKPSARSAAGRAATPTASARTDQTGANKARPASPPEAGSAPRSAESAVSAAELEALEALPAAGGLWSIGERQLKLSNLDKVLWPTDGVTKRDLIRYYSTIAPYVLPYLRDRALTLQRYPDGVERAGFWQKQVPGHAPDWVKCWPWISRSKGDATDYLIADAAPTLAWIANEAAIDIHPSTYRIDAPDRPTWALVDIDPGPATTWQETLLLARLYRTALDHVGVRGFPKLSGQRGIQVWIPVRPVYTFDQTRDWVAELSKNIAAAAPELISWEWEKTRRDGLARLDYTQNAWNKTLVAPYSVRPVAGATVSAPIAWDELDDPDMRAGRWTIHTIAARIRERGDLFAPSLAMEQELPPL
jgi:bifunctional non-homologous end joining protein LigD